MYRLRNLTILISLVFSSASSQAGFCPDYSSVDHPPTFVFPPQRDFRHWVNLIISQWGPYHMVHDVVVAEGDASTMVGKFDYGRVLHKDLEREWVHAYITGTGLNDWEYLGGYRTDGDGKVYVPVEPLPEGDYRVRMVAEGDLTWVDGFLSVVQRGRKAVVFDIDGTVTHNAIEIGILKAQAQPFVLDVIEAYMEKGYAIVFLTGRPYWLAKDTRDWLVGLGLPAWHLKTNPVGELIGPGGPFVYKRDYLLGLLDGSGVDIVRAYGNAMSDIDAYQAAGIPKAATYIVGENAGASGTQPVEDYGSHLTQIVLPTPEADCEWRPCAHR